jgi:crotonobetainyl-CoA:carnitine CoA-transferase CaiB-like acyl-CoA transferase
MGFMTQEHQLGDVVARIWREAGGPPDALAGLTTTGPRQVLPSVFDVTGLAAGSIAAATLAAAEFHAARTGARPRAVSVDSRAACAAFAAEALFTPVGWDRPEVWDPIAGNYQAQDAWVRLHTNYAYHRAAVEQVLGARDQEAVAAAVREWKAGELEAAVVGAGGCAAVMRTREQWLASPPGLATAGAPALSTTFKGLSPRTSPASAAPAAHHEAAAVAPFSGIRVLDLTRVIAGPVATKFLAAYGADVLRVDPPGFQEVAAILPETTAGKRATALDLTTPDGRRAFEGLLATADVLVSGLRADALDKLGYDDGTLAALSPALIIASHNAYGWDGPWRDRRGFDSLVQMSCGIAAAPGQDRPAPLPVQALDHATGYLLATAVGRALTRRLTESAVSRVRASLIGTAGLLWSLPRPQAQPPRPGPGEFTLVDTATAWGPARRVPPAGEIAGIEAGWRVEAGPLGRHEPAWSALPELT